jgi:hypothetical protein
VDREMSTSLLGCTMMRPPAVGTESRSLSATVVEAVAAAEHVSPSRLEPPLYRVVDPDALDALFRKGVRGTVRFEYGDHLVEVTADGTVSVDGTAHEEP